jgi:putative hemin transport protein
MMDGLLPLVPPHELTARWRALRASDPRLTITEVATRLDVSEAELVSSLCGDGIIRLVGPYGDLVRSLPSLGTVRAVTRNAHASIETLGIYPAPDTGCAGAVGEIGARFLLDQWRYGYALDDVDTQGLHRSLRFFDDRGDPVHEVFAGADTSQTQLGRLIDLFACFDQSQGEEITRPSLLARRAACDAGLSLRRVDSARPVGRTALSAVLEVVLGDAVPVSIAVRSLGVVQRFSGLLHEADVIGDVCRLRAPRVRMQVRTDRIVEAWVVRTPSLDGPTLSLELLDARAASIVSLSGARWPGQPEPLAWREALDGLPTVA